jgi:hypothetical protein
VGDGQSEWVIGGSGVDSMLQFRLEMRSDGMNHCRKMKQIHQAHLGSMGRKHDTIRWCGNIGQRRGGTGEGKGMRRRQLG